MAFKLHYKTPLTIVFAMLVNLVLIIALEILLVYKFPAQLTDKDLARVDPMFEGCTILMNDGINRDQFRLVQTREGQQYMVPLRIHPVFFSRCRIYSGEIKEVTEKTETQDFRLGTRQYHVIVNPDFLQVSSAGGHMGQQTRQMSQQTSLLYYQGLSLLLGLAELGILEKIRGK